MLSLEGCEHVRDAHLAALAPLGGSLTALILNRCGRPGPRAPPHLSSGGLRALAALRGLRQLGLRETCVHDEGESCFPWPTVLLASRLLLCTRRATWLKLLQCAVQQPWASFRSGRDSCTRHVARKAAKPSSFAECNCCGCSGSVQGLALAEQKWQGNEACGLMLFGFGKVCAVSRRLGNAAHIHGLCQRLRRTCSCADLAYVGAHCSNLEALDLTDALEFNGRCAPWSSAVRD